MPNAGQPFILADEILTKLKTVDGAGSGLDADLLDGKEASAFPEKLTSSITVTVGSGGDFDTISEALDYLVKTYYPIYDKSNQVIQAYIKLLSGFTMQEQIFLYFIDLSWICIVSDDLQVSVSTSMLNESRNNYYPVFFGSTGAKLPRIGTIFSLDSSGTSEPYVGAYIYSDSEVHIDTGKGFINSPHYNVVIERNSRARLNGATFTGAGDTGIFISGGCVVDCEGVDVSNCETGLYVGNGSVVNAKSITANSCSHYGVVVSGGSQACLDGATVTDAGWDNIYVTSASQVSCELATAADAGRYGIKSARGSVVNAYNVDASNAGSYGFRVEEGGIIAAKYATGTLSQTANSITSNGIIFQ